jgi:hypothetical protein
MLPGPASCWLLPTPSGRKELVELVPGGRDIRVTEAKKRVYVDLIAAHRMTTSIKHQGLPGGLLGARAQVRETLSLRGCVSMCRKKERMEWT